MFQSAVKQSNSFSSLDKNMGLLLLFFFFFFKSIDFKKNEKRREILGGGDRKEKKKERITNKSGPTEKIIWNNKTSKKNKWNIIWVPSANRSCLTKKMRGKKFVWTKSILNFDKKIIVKKRKKKIIK